MKLNKKAIYLAFILSTIVLNLTAVYIIRMWIQQMYEAHKIEESSALITVIDKLSYIPIIYWCVASFSLGMIVMYGLNWCLSKEPKE